MFEKFLMNKRQRTLMKYQNHLVLHRDDSDYSEMENDDDPTNDLGYNSDEVEKYDGPTVLNENILKR